jgi:hypothetical protein
MAPKATTATASTSSALELGDDLAAQSTGFDDGQSEFESASLHR